MNMEDNQHSDIPDEFSGQQEINNMIGLIEGPQTQEEALPSQGPVMHDVHEFEPEPEALIKAMLFASPEFVTISTIKRVFDRQYTATQIKSFVKKINRQLSDNNDPFEIAEINNSFQYRTRSQYHPWLKLLFKEAGARRLSQAALEILSLVAYKQPITKAEVEDIRGVNVDGPLKGLLDRKLIAITGKSDKIGHPFVYGTTKEFMQYFNINRVPEDLPKLSEFENLISSTSLLPQISSSGEVTEIQQNLAEEE
ncbi:MAG: SMC-Scp complex subunit ScpB [Fibrobacteria bacterium]|nr:SMC-Scp complex subunit ScpB [Fibrobacteria bacterium]